MNREEHNFGGRLYTKPKAANRVDLTTLRYEKVCFIYKRLSTQEQVSKNYWSLELQDKLADQARQDGYPDGLIYVEDRDLGLSGTLGREARPGLDYLIQLVEADRIESLYVVQIGRLYRDETLIRAFDLGELLKEHGVILVTPDMRLNLQDNYDMKTYRREMEQAADELKVMKGRMLATRELKAKAGRYCGEGLPVGYVVDMRESVDGERNLNRHGYLVHEPHAKVIRWIFDRLAMPVVRPGQLARLCKAQGIVFPFFPRELDIGANRKSFVNTRRLPDGWVITAARIKRIATNPAYIGWKFWGGELVGENIYPPIIDEDVFWRVQEKFGHSLQAQPQPKGDFDLLLLAGLLYCGEHDSPRRMAYSNRKTARKSLYQCVDSAFREECVCISAYILDEPIGEAVVSQIAVPELAEEVLTKLTDEYQQVKERAASYRREINRLEGAVDGLLEKLEEKSMEPAVLARVNERIAQHMARIHELSVLESQPIGQAVGRSTPGQADIDLVTNFLANLPDQWDNMPSGLKNSLLHLLLDKIVIWHADPLVIYVRLFWKVGLEQCMVIYRPYSSYKKKQRQRWTQEEVAVLRTHYATAYQEQLLEMLPGREWLAVTYKANSLGLPSRPAHLSRPTQVSPLFTPQEDELIRKYYAGEISAMEVMATTGREMISIRRRAHRLGLKLQRRVLWEWVDEKGAGTIMSKSNSSSPPACPR